MGASFMIAVQRLEGDDEGFVAFDAQSRMYEVRTADEAWSLLKQLRDDEGLPVIRNAIAKRTEPERRTEQVITAPAMPAGNDPKVAAQELAAEVKARVHQKLSDEYGERAATLVVGAGERLLTKIVRPRGSARFRLKQSMQRRSNAT